MRSDGCRNAWRECCGSNTEKAIALRIIRHGGELFDAGEYALSEFANDAAACVDDEAVSAVMCSGVELSAADICKLVDAGNFKFGKVCNFGQCSRCCDLRS